MLYSYKSKSTSGDIISGTIEANSTVDAQQMLRKQGQLLLSISTSHQNSFRGSLARLSGSNRVPQRELLMLTSQLAIMSETGVDLAEGIGQIAEQCAHKMLRETLRDIHRSISEGIPVSQALAKHPGVFDVGYIATVAAGEASGRMAEVLDRLTNTLRNEIRTKSMLKTVMAYPVILFALSFVVVGVLLFFVLPHFGEIFEDMKVPLPVTTKWLLSLSGSLRQHWMFWLGGAGAMDWCNPRMAFGRISEMDRRNDADHSHRTGCFPIAGCRTIVSVTGSNAAKRRAFAVSAATCSRIDSEFGLSRVVQQSGSRSSQRSRNWCRTGRDAFRAWRSLPDGADGRKNRTPGDGDEQGWLFL